MKPEEQRIAIAEACGWTFITRGTRPYGLPPNDKHALRESPLPDYLNDLNAMHEAERMMIFSTIPGLSDGYYFKFEEELHRLIDPWDAGATNTHATAAQRAEAFLKTLSLWKP